jgi:hypothetical protein
MSVACTLISVGPSLATTCKGRTVEGMSVETAAGGGNCHIFPLNSTRIMGISERWKRFELTVA